MFEKFLKLIQNHRDSFKVNLEGNLIHNIVKPLDFGTYANTEMLSAALKFGFSHKVRNQEGLTPI